MSFGARTWQIRWTRWRRTSQIAFVLFFLLLPLSYRWGQESVLGTLASLKMGPIDLVDPATGLSTILASQSASRTLLLGMLLPFALALVLGPVFCSWVCPWGLLSELIDKLRGRGRRRSGRRQGRLSFLRWSVLAAVMLLSGLLSTPLVATLSAPRLISALPLELIFLGGVSGGSLLLLAAFLLFELVLPRRFWCRTLCPVGSTLVLLRIPWTLRVSWRQPTCQPELLGANCVQVCSWQLDPRHMTGYQGCTNCGACVEGCPSSKRSLHFVLGQLADRSDGRTLPVFNGRM